MVRVTAWPIPTGIGRCEAAAVKTLQGRLILAFAAVSLVSIAAVGAITTAAVRTQFERYFQSVPVAPRPEGEGMVPPPGAPLRPRSAPHMEPPGAMREMMRRAMGSPEFQFLMQLRRATWQAVFVGVVAAVVLGVVVARYVTAPLRLMSDAAARVGAGDLAQQVPVPSDGDLGHLAAAFNRMTSDLQRLEQSRRHLVADIAHELGTPLSVLQANLEGMLDGVVEPTPDRLAALHTHVRLLVRLVEDLRDLSLAQAGRLPLDRHSVDLAALLGDAAAAVAAHAALKGVTVERQIATGVPPVTVDRERMMQIVNNLLDNAIRHTPAGGVVTLGLEIEGVSVSLWVRDTGPGIAPEETERIFDRFHRLDASRSRASGGSGLGLAIVKSLAEAHGGRVLVRSRAGEGSTFAVVLPLVA